MTPLTKGLNWGARKYLAVRSTGPSVLVGGGRDFKTKVTVRESSKKESKAQGRTPRTPLETHSICRTSFQLSWAQMNNPSDTAFFHDARGASQSLSMHCFSWKDDPSLSYSLVQLGVDLEIDWSLESFTFSNIGVWGIDYQCYSTVQLEDKIQ
ncbi:hypothetical protein BYT27DRAFT_6447183 [Phlegmacium glaucopus]|nr:hypothetical protein BYT27DRAFT_6447183 [Phlegmacium glaucopus]